MATETPIYPEPPSGTVTVSGATVAEDGVLTSTATSVSISRTVQPLFVAGGAGRLVWAASVTTDVSSPDPIGPLTSVTFRMTSEPARREVTRTGIVAGSSASAVLEIPAGDPPVTLQIVVACDIGIPMAFTDRWLQATREDVGIMPADLTFGDVSPNGVPAPPPSAGLPVREAASPARRSPQVRAAQSDGTRRPDLMARASSLL